MSVVVSVALDLQCGWSDMVAFLQICSHITIAINNIYYK